jgi:hypothetical protein
MATALVELIGSMSYTRQGRTFKKNQPQLITNAAEIAFYQSQSIFVVTARGETPKTDAEVPTPAKIEKPVTETTKAVIAKAETPQAKAEASQPKKEQRKPIIHSKDKLKGMKRSELIEAASALVVFLDGTEKKEDMIAAILKAQKKLES